MSEPPEDGRRRRNRRRAPSAARFDTSVSSPCIGVCQIDDGTGLCLGCRRTIDEIREWMILSAEEKTEVLGRIAEREAAPDRAP